MPIGGVVGGSHVRAVLLKASLTLGACAVGVNHAAYCSEVAGFELGDCGANLGDTTNDLMSGDAWIDSRYAAVAPLVSYCMEVRMADTAKENFDLNIVFARLTPRNSTGGKGRFRSCSGVSLRIILSM